jgi:hypothetical protein
MTEQLNKMEAAPPPETVDAAAEQEDEADTREEVFERCAELATADDVFARIVGALRQTGFAGKTIVFGLTYLAMVTRLFVQPVSVAIRGPSAAGKSYTIKQVVAFMPSEAYVEVTAMSEKALVYFDADLRHKVLIVYEAAGIAGDFLAYAVRSLLSEGRLEYVVTDFENRGTVTIVKEGPTGLVLSSAGPLDAELVTRVITPSVADTPELTREILRTVAVEAAGMTSAVDLEPFRDLQRYIALGSREAIVPFARRLAEETDPQAVRLRRDFTATLGLTKAHALLHQHHRERDSGGRLVADPADYAGVYELVAEMIAEGAERTVPDSVRETVDAVRSLFRVPGGPETSVSIAALAKHLGITRSSASRRAARALALGFLKDNSGGGRGKPRLLEQGDPMPEDTGVLPPPEILE